MRAPERDSTPIARPYFLAWLASGTDDYDKNTIESSPRWFASEDPAGEVAQVPASLISDPATGKLWKANSSGVLEEVGTLAGAQSWTGLQVFEAHARFNDASALKFGTPGTDLVMTPDGTNVVVTGTGKLRFVDDLSVQWGTGGDLSVLHNGTDTIITSITGNLDLDNTAATGATYVTLGTDTSATEFAVRGNGLTRRLIVTGAGQVDIPGNLDASGGVDIDADSVALTLGASADDSVTHNGTDSIWTHNTGNLVLDNTFVTGFTHLDLGTDDSATGFRVRNNSGTVLFQVGGGGVLQLPDGTTLQRPGAGTGTGDVIERIGASLTEGMEVRVFDAVIATGAIENAILTLPANSVVDSVQANVASALTGGGTTATFSIGITGDVDLFGTAWAAGAQSDLLAQNSKADFIGTKAGAGAGVGVFNPAAVAVKLIGAATGGAAAGDTALTVGTVRVVIRYRVLLSLANA